MESESAARVKRIIIWDAAVSGSPRWLGWLIVVGGLKQRNSRIRQ